MRLLIIFTFYIIFTHLGAIKAIVFFHFPRSFQHQSLTSDQTNDENPSFFSVFRHRNLNPFQNFLGDVIKTSTTKDESKVNDSLDFKTDGNMNASDLKPKHHVLKKDMENSTKLVGLDRYYPPWRRFISLRDLKPLVYTNNILKTTQSGNPLDNYLKSNSSNNTSAGNASKDSLPLYEENCTRRHYISRYLFVWTINNWASLAVHLTVILILSSFVTFAIVFCRSWCSYDQSASKLYKIKPLSV